VPPSKRDGYRDAGVDWAAAMACQAMLNCPWQSSMGKGVPLLSEGAAQGLIVPRMRRNRQGTNRYTVTSFASIRSTQAGASSAVLRPRDGPEKPVVLSAASPRVARDNDERENRQYIQ
jgi:hypothetical protein